MNAHPEPRFARIATTIGDPTRARMLAALMGGEFLAAGELARAAGVTPQTATAHLAQLVDAGLVVERRQGRHRYLRIADAEVARVLESLSLVAERRADGAKWEQGAYKPLKAARTCYDHLAGELGVALFAGLLARGTIEPAAEGFALSTAGREHWRALGLDPEPAGPRARVAYACLDWSERRDHLGGRLAAQLLVHGLARRWLRRVPGSRALVLLPAGRAALAPWLAAHGAADAVRLDGPAPRGAQVTSQAS
jgi:DNA-binding transcriptional ArsR family regulator